MKNIRLTIYAFMLCLLASCDAGFDEINTSKTGIVNVNPVYELNNAMLRSSFHVQTIHYEEAIVQQIVSPNGGLIASGNFNQENRGVTLFLWQKYYRDVMKSVVDVLKLTENDPNRSNLYNMARIWRAYTIMLLTDTYGNVPFTQAGLGYRDQIISPEYDTQEFIYTTILSELEDASAKLDAAKFVESGDIMYSGSIPKWKKLGYSLMLRAAMRLSKVDQQTAKNYVQKAVAGGVMTANSDNAAIRHSANFTNDIGAMLNSNEAANFYLTAPFVDSLRSRNDPRLGSIAVRYVGAPDASKQIESFASRDTAVQIGMPMGYNNGSIGVKDQAGTPVGDEGLESYYEYSQLDRTRMGSNVAPMFFVTVAQTKLLLAEAVVRTWTTGDASQLYSDAIRAHMEQLADYGASSAVPAGLISDYIADYPLDMSKAFQEINLQYWIASFLNGPEAFANFRRSGFPKLKPNLYPERTITGNFINRLSYPDTEFAVNTANVNAAVEMQGPDNLDTHVWWDVEL